MCGDLSSKRGTPTTTPGVCPSRAYTPVLTCGTGARGGRFTGWPDASKDDDTEFKDVESYDKSVRSGSPDNRSEKSVEERVSSPQPTSVSYEIPQTTHSYANGEPTGGMISLNYLFICKLNQRILMTILGRTFIAIDHLPTQAQPLSNL